jgi:LCP family protein required for cell wall assembly
MCIAGALTLLTACTRATDVIITATTDASTTTTQPTTTSTAPTTTTTLPAASVSGTGNADVVDLLTRFYGYARGDSVEPPSVANDALLPQPGSLDAAGTVQVEASVRGVGDVVVAVATAGSDLMGLYKDGNGWRVVAGKAPSVGVGGWYFSEPMLVAVVGSDARPGQDVEASRADSIHIVGLDGAGSASMVGVPRDSWVPIAGGGSNKINAALADHGPDGMVATFEDLSGLDLDGYLMTGFEGFEKLVDDVLGPFTLDVPFAFSDRAAKADFDEGPTDVDGDGALSFVRARKSFVNGDFQRQLNGGLLLLAGVAGAKLRGPLAVPDMIARSQRWLHTDLTPDQLLRLALAAHDVDLLGVSNVVLEGSTGTTSRGASIVRLDQAFAEETFADLADGVLGN